MKAKLISILKIPLYICYLLVLFVGLGLAYEKFLRTPSSSQIERYLDETDFEISGKIECVECCDQSKQIYKMSYDEVCIKNKVHDDECYWGGLDTIKKNIYFCSYELKLDSVYINSKERRISCSVNDTSKIVQFRVFDLYIRRLEKYAKEGTIKF